MSIRAGASRRTRWGSVWVSMPAGLVALVALLVFPYLLSWWVLRLLLAVTIWAVHSFVLFVREVCRGH